MENLDVESMKYIAEAIKYLAIGLLGLPILGVAKGVATVFETYITSTSRNPNAKKDIYGLTLVGAGMIEGAGILAIGLGFFMFLK